jgi:uncharacterized protein YjbI with pentapeptide repeats
LEILNQTNFNFANIIGRINFPGHSLSLIIKGTFHLNQNSVATQAEDQLYPMGDEFFPDDVEMQGSCCYESDFAYFKPKADLLLSGHCHAPNGSPVPACQIKFQVGAHEKTLNIFGDRQWKRSLGIRTITDPEPFTKMELKYENSFGGQGYKKNPVGKGVTKQEAGDGKKAILLPNIEDPENIISSPRYQPEPAGFGPLCKTWEHRLKRMGTYKGKYLKKRWPWFAEDFDYGYFNAAPPDMQVEGYLRGDEELYFKNLHSEYSRFKSRLPGIRIRCFVNKLADTVSGDTEFKEIKMNLDTLWADMDNEKLVLVWRGVTEIQSEEYEELLHTFIISEPLSEQPATVENCREMFLATITEEEEAAEVPEEQEIETEDPEIAKPEDEPEEVKQEEPPKKLDLKKLIKAQINMILVKMGIDIENLPPQTREKTEKEQDKILDRLFEKDPDKKMAMEQVEHKERLSKDLSKLGIDLDNLPPLSDKAKKEQLKLLSAFGMDNPSIVQSPEMAPIFGVLQAVIPRMGLDPENLDPFIAEAKKQRENIQKKLGMEAGEESVEEETTPALTREIVQERAARNDSFGGEDLRGIDLSDLDLKGINFSGANLTGVVLKNSDLEKANLTNAVLTEADLSNANLADALLTGADLDNTNLEGSILENAIIKSVVLKNTVLTNSNLKGADLTGSDISDSDLEGLDLTNAVLKGVDFTNANLSNTILIASDLSDANLKKSNLSGADLSEANLTNAVLIESLLENAELKNADFSKADLKKSNLKKASLEEADFSEADLTDSDLSETILNEAIFEKANMQNALLIDAEAVDANFSEADLTNAKLSNGDFSKADFSKSVLNEADFSNARMEDASVEGAKGTNINFRKADLTRLRASEGCDFTGSRFREAKGAESIWHDAVLKNADFTLSNMHGADFTKADLQNADFSAADMKYARFMKADMKLAKLLYMNLFEGNLEKADLTGADLTGSNMYGVEFLDAVIDHTKMENMNLKMTKLG